MEEWKLTSRSPRRCSCSCVCWVLGWEEESDWRWAVSSSSAVSSASLCPLSAHWLSPVVYTDTQQHKKVKSSVVSCYKFKSFLFRTTHFLVFLSISFHSIHKGLHTLHSLHVCFLKILANMIIRSNWPYSVSVCQVCVYATFAYSLKFESACMCNSRTWLDSERRSHLSTAQ